MRKRIRALVIVCLLLWAGQAAFAQESKWRLGLRVSPNISLLSVTDKSGNPIDPEVLNINKPTRIGFSGGLQVTYQFVEKFGLQTGLLVGTQGFTVNTRTFGNSENALQQQKINLVMLQVPLALHLRTQELSNKLSRVNDCQSLRLLTTFLNLSMIAFQNTYQSFQHFIIKI